MYTCDGINDESVAHAMPVEQSSPGESRTANVLSASKTAKTIKNCGFFESFTLMSSKMSFSVAESNRLRIGSIRGASEMFERGENLVACDANGGSNDGDGPRLRN